MERNGSRTVALALGAAAFLAAAMLYSPITGNAAGLAFNSVVSVGAFGGEPSLLSDANGVLYDSTPSGPQTYRSNNQGASWTHIQSPDSNSGDDCLARDQANPADQSNALYWCNLGSGTAGKLPLQADVWKSLIAPTCLASCSWIHGAGAISSPTTCSTSCNAFGVDRQWTASYVAPGQTTAHSEVVLMYHDFYGPSHIWVNISHDGGASFGAAQEVLSSPAVTPGAVSNSLLAEGYTFCNSVPAGVGIVPPGKPNAGRIIVAWIASDPAQDGSGCNITMVQSFHTAWVSYSDPTTPGGSDAGATWTPQQAFDSGVGHDMSTPFASFALDNLGNPYIGFDANRWVNGPTNLTNPPACAGFSSAPGQVLQTHPECGYDMYVVWSNDQGAHWDHTGGSGTVPGSAAAPYLANSDNGTDVFPTIAAGDPGKVDVSWLHTNTIEPTDSVGKFQPGGCAGPDSSVPSSANYPPPCQWNLVAGQSLNLTAAPGTASFARVPVTTTPMHVGDICNLGIFCVSPDSDRSLLDFNQETVDPTTGCGHIAYSDNNGPDGTFHTTPPSLHDNHLVAANQTSGPSIISGKVCTAPPNINIPETPWPAFLVPIGAVAALLGWQARRRAKRYQALAP